MRFRLGPIWGTLFIFLAFLPTCVFATTLQAGPWLQALTETSVVIMWETDTYTHGVVRIGETTAYNWMQASSAKPIAATSVSGDTNAILHEVKLTGLYPGTRYYYQVETDNAQSPVHTFMTLTDANRAVWHFTHTASPNALVTSKANRTWASMSAVQPDFMVISGDISNKATNHDFRKFFVRAYPVTANIPVYTVQGNHDDREWSVYDAWVHNDMPDRASERFYAFDIGPGHFVAINDNTPRADAFPVDWFERTLAQSRARWNIVFMNGNYRKYSFMQQLLANNKANIDVILTSGSGAQYIDQDGILHVESGGADQVYHLVEMTDTSFRATLYRSDGSKQGSQMLGVPEEEPNMPPVARLSATPLHGVAPLEVIFDGTASTDREAAMVAYDWEFGDGAIASGAVVQHTYVDAGTYTARLIVTDAAGASAITETLITVEAATSNVDELVANGSFEDLDEGQQPYDWHLGATGAWQVVDSRVSTGIYSLQLESADQSVRTPIASAMAVSLGPGAYVLCADLRTELLGTQDGKRRGIRVSLKDESIQQGSGNIASTDVVQGTHDWLQACQNIAILQAGDYTVRIEAVNKPNGRAWIDAVSLTKEDKR